MDEYDYPSVPEEELSEFADNLFGYLYYYLNMQSRVVRPRGHFEKVIGSALFKVERNTYSFNKHILSIRGFETSQLDLCQKICSSYSVMGYFKKFYYTTAFIVDLMVWRCSISNAVVDLSEGPRIWKIIFRNNFESKFYLLKGWRGLVEAARDIVECPPDLMLVPNFFWTMFSGQRPIREYDPAVMQRVTESLRRIKISSSDTDEEETEEIEDSNELEDSHEGPSQPSSAAGGHLDESKRKRRHRAAARDSDPDSNSPCHSKAKMERRKQACSVDPKPSTSGSKSLSSSKPKVDRRKRIRDVDSKDSDSESDSNSPSKAKMERKCDETSKNSDSESKSHSPPKRKSTEDVDNIFLK